MAIAEFCQQHGCSTASFYLWRRVIDALRSLTRHHLVTGDGNTPDLYTDPTSPQRIIIRQFGMAPAHSRLFSHPFKKLTYI